MRFAERLPISAAVLVAATSASGQTTATVPPTVNNTVASQSAVPGQTVTAAHEQEDAARDALTPVGAHFGSFTLYPKLESTLTYNDNIYAVQDRTSDVIARISPSVDLRGDFGTLTTALRASLDRYQYVSNPTENRTDGSIGGNAQAEVRRDTFVYLAGGYSAAHEDRGDPNALFTDRTPTAYRLTEAGLGFSSDLTRISYGMDGSFRNYDFENNVQRSGVPINNKDRDRKQYRVAARLGYEFSPGYRLLARGAYERVDYTQPVDDAGFDRTSRGFRGTLGVEFELTRLLNGEVFGGYLERSYDDVRFPKIDAAVFGAKLTWRPTALTTVRLDLDRSVQETVVAGFRGFLATTGSLSVEHELLRTVILTGSVRYERDSYKGSTTSVAVRNDDNEGASAGVRYILNRNVYAGLSYDWSKRGSNFVGPGLSFGRNRVSATFGLQF